MHHCQGSFNPRHTSMAKGNKLWQTVSITISLRTQPFTPIERNLVAEKLETGRVMLGITWICLKALGWGVHHFCHYIFRLIWVFEYAPVDEHSWLEFAHFSILKYIFIQGPFSSRLCWEILEIITGEYLEDHPMTCKWLTMVIVSSLSRVDLDIHGLFSPHDLKLATSHVS